ncbi:UNVERIFIED_CONTAM: hypothetical protein HDU68_005634 [Siphonaria sp. JEL0065]|nr:hypothetical protein HDU68_005634 [Siphonaria sp. JEL0065]
MKPGFLNYTGATTTDLFEYIISETYKSYWENMNVKGIKFLTTSVNRIMDLHLSGMKDEVDELLLKGQKKAGHVEWLGRKSVPLQLQHVDEIFQDMGCRSSVDFTFPSKRIRRDVFSMAPEQFVWKS